jgi:multidrug efflux pump subunit AcrA (membrane-fusion protein)
MKKQIAIVLTFAMLALIVYRAYTNYQIKKSKANQPVPVKVVSVSQVTPQWQNVARTILANGNLQSMNDVTLYSKVNGKLVRTTVQMGSSVKPGMMVATVRRDDIGYEFNDYGVHSDVKGVVLQVLQNPGATITPNTPLMTLVNIDTVKAILAVDEAKIRFIRIGQPAVVTLEAFPGESFHATVHQISPVCNPQTRMIDVELYLPNQPHRLKPGMYAQALFEAGQRKTMTVAMAAVTVRGTDRYVFTMQDGKAVRLPVRTGDILGDRLEILSGLQGTETLIGHGSDQVEDGAEVKVVAR